MKTPRSKPNKELFNFYKLLNIKEIEASTTRFKDSLCMEQHEQYCINNRTTEVICGQLCIKIPMIFSLNLKI